MFSFLFPWALWGFLAIPLLVGIYFLRARFRQQKVSSLFLWKREVDMLEGGLRIESFQNSPIFWLEIAALVALVLAAADPVVSFIGQSKDLVIVLDDSYSMLAGGKNSAHEKALIEIRAEMLHRGRVRYTFIAAGEKPEILGNSVHLIEEAEPLLKRWRCRASQSVLEEALIFALETGGRRADILILTDHHPKFNQESEREPGRVVIKAFGEQRENVALVNAVRTPRERGDRLLFEITNFGRNLAMVDFRLETRLGEKQKAPEPFKLEGGESRRLTAEVGSMTGEIIGRLGPDDLELDNCARLMPVALKPLRVTLSLHDPQVSALFERGLTATRKVVLGSGPADLFVTDHPLPAGGTPVWAVEIASGSPAAAYLGPFVMDRSSVLTEGLSLEGTVWGAPKADLLSGRPLIMAGNIPLLSERESGAVRSLRMAFRADLSTLPISPDWPILLWNLVLWRQQFLPMFGKRNLKLGERTSVRLDSEVETAVLRAENGETWPIAVHAGEVFFFPEDVGFFTLEAGKGTWPFAVNTLNPRESDLSGCCSGSWSTWAADGLQAQQTRSLRWAFLMLGFCALSFHQVLLNRLGRRRKKHQAGQSQPVEGMSPSHAGMT